MPNKQNDLDEIPDCSVFLYFIGFYNSVKCFKYIFHSRLVSFLSLQYDRILVLPPLLLYVI